MFRAPNLPVPRKDTQAYLADLHRELQNYLSDLAAHHPVPAWRTSISTPITLTSDMQTVLSQSMGKQPKAFTVVLFVGYTSDSVQGQILRGTTEIFPTTDLGTGSVVMLSLEEPSADEAVYTVKMSGPGTLQRGTLLITELRG